MSEIITPGAGIIFMKVGTHEKEPLDEIIARKRKEIEDAGFGLWGYGGGTCNPESMVQPFAKKYERLGRTIYLCMEEIQSNHFAEQVRADESSADGLNWIEIPPAINVLGSRFALVIKNLRKEDLTLPLGLTRVGLGPSQGASGETYVRGRVDKGCLEVIESPGPESGGPGKLTAISLVAELASPFAVFLRNRRR